ncbi:MAG: 30S ribosomal protein S9 [Proteobacteria bacterium]|nr:30S ribosomal protein S9 [Pseudomonadota bacterium]
MAESPAAYTDATGKRKTAIARVRLKLGSGSMLVNNKPVAEYFPREVHQILIREPLEVVDAVTRYDIVATIRGGGPAGQAGALRHGISRAIQKLDPEQRPALKSRGLLTRDARKKERKKYGQKGARARFQFSKR